MSKLAKSTLVTVVVCWLASLEPALAKKSVAESYPLMVDEGNDSYLVLNDEEILKNPKLLKQLSTASKEEVEEIVDGNPFMQAALLNKIKETVEQKKLKAAPAASKSLLETNRGKYQAYYQDVVSISDGDLSEDDDDDEDDDLPADEVSVAKWKDKFKDKSSKIFKIGNKFKEKLMGLKRKKAAKKEAKQSAWPHFHYKFSHN